MDINSGTIDKVIKILHEEIVPAEGCTEPIAIALVAATVKEILGNIPDRLEIYVSGNIIKNVKGVIVPNSGGIIGIEASAAMGIIAGDYKKNLMVISEVTSEDIEKVKKYLKNTPIKIIHKKTDIKLFVKIKTFYENESASVEIAYLHTNITKVEKNGEVLLDRACGEECFNTSVTDRNILSIELIYNLTKTIDLELIRPLFEKVIDLNTKIAEEGLSGEYGVNIGSCILKNIGIGIYGDDSRNRCASFAAAGSDARMSGCPLPVMIVSGSGNQGMTASLPVIKYCQERKFDKEKMIRGLFLSHLSTIHIKTQVGSLSAYCGVMCAAAGVGGSIAFLIGGDYRTVASSIINTLGNVSGVICDGAKASCAMKIATGVYAAFDAATLAFYHNFLHGGDGIIGKDVETTIKNIGELAQKGMNETDEVILRIMTK